MKSAYGMRSLASIPGTSSQACPASSPSPDAFRDFTGDRRLFPGRGQTAVTRGAAPTPGFGQVAGTVFSLLSSVGPGWGVRVPSRPFFGRKQQEENAAKRSYWRRFRHQARQWLKVQEE